MTDQNTEFNELIEDISFIQNRERRQNNLESLSRLLRLPIKCNILAIYTIYLAIAFPVCCRESLINKSPLPLSESPQQSPSSSPTRSDNADSEDENAEFPSRINARKAIEGLRKYEKKEKRKAKVTNRIFEVQREESNNLKLNLGSTSYKIGGGVKTKKLGLNLGEEGAQMSLTGITKIARGPFPFTSAPMINQKKKIKGLELSENGENGLILGKRKQKECKGEDHIDNPFNISDLTDFTSSNDIPAPLSTKRVARFQRPPRFKKCAQIRRGRKKGKSEIYEVQERCVICNWKYPVNYSVKKKSDHINKCIDSGKSSTTNNLDKLGSPTRGQYIYIKEKGVEPIEIIGKPLKNGVFRIQCPICKEEIKLKEEYIQKHVKICKQEQLELEQSKDNSESILNKSERCKRVRACPARFTPDEYSRNTMRIYKKYVQIHQAKGKEKGSQSAVPGVVQQNGYPAPMEDETESEEEYMQEY